MKFHINFILLQMPKIQKFKLIFKATYGVNERK